MLIITACGSDSKESSATSAAGDTTAASTATTAAGGGGTATTAAGGGAADLSALYDACKAEGQVNLIALPDDWANYKGILQSFRDKYPGVNNPVASPDFSSQQELDAVKNLAGQKDMPDSIDVSPAKAQDAITAGYFDPYKPTTSADIPTGLKDPNNNWVGAYYGIIAITTNTTVVKNPPKTFADLKKPEYKGMVALNDDPRKAGAAFAGVMAASLANGGSPDDIMPGIQFFADLKNSGNLILTDVNPTTMIQGETPIVLDWTYNFPSLQPKMKDAGFDLSYTVPTDGVYGSYYAQGVIADCPQPNAAKLWIEHILSNDGALGYLEGGAIPARYAELQQAGLVTPDVAKNLPDASVLAQIKFPSDAQLAKANQVLTDNWGTMVAGS